MNLFDKRPLSIILSVYLGGFVFFSLFDLKIGLFAIIAALLFPIPFFFGGLKRHRLFALIISLALILSAVFSYIYFTKYFSVEKRFEEEVTIEAEVMGVKDTTSYSTVVTLKTKNIDGKIASRYKLIYHIPTKDNRLYLGDTVTFKGRLTGFEDGGDFDSKSYYYSDGICGSIENMRDLQIIERDEDAFKKSLYYYRETIRRKAALASDSESGTLLGALLTGERSELSPELRLDFTRIGISHVLALSGMHLAILTIALERILKAMGVKKRVRGGTSILFCILYMGFVGFTVSVVRAGIMLILRSLLDLIHEGHDTVTSLFVAVFLICLFTPYAIYDTALWLSAFATLGVILAASHREKKNERLILKPIYIVTDSVFSSVMANAATLLISVLAFGGFSLLSPVTTLLFSLFIEIYMYLGCLVILVALIYEPLALPFGKLLTLLYAPIEELSAQLSEFELSYINSGYGILLELIFAFSVIFFVLLILPIKKAVASVLIITLFTSLFVTAGIYKMTDKGEDLLLYRTGEKEDLFLIRSGKETALISSSQYDKSLSYNARKLLSEYNITELDYYIVTHYAYSLEEDFTTLLSGVLIKNISIPFPRNKDEEMLYKSLKKALKPYRVNLTLHKAAGIVEIGEFEYRPIFSNPYGEGSSVNAFLIDYKGSFGTLYLSSGMLLEEYEHYKSAFIDRANYLVFGSHGRKYKDHIYISDYRPSVNGIIVSSENIYFNQTPYYEYMKNGCKIHLHPNTVNIIGN